MVGDEMDQLAVEPENCTQIAVAQLHRTPRDHVEHWLRIARGARNHPQDLAGAGLPLERLRELGCSSRNLLFQVVLRILQPRSRAVELVGKCLELVTGADVDAMIQIAAADARRTVLQPADWRDHSAGQCDARQDGEQKTYPQHDDAARRRGAQRSERILDRALDEHQPAKRRNRGMNGKRLAALQSLGNGEHRVVLRTAAVR